MILGDTMKRSLEKQEHARHQSRQEHADVAGMMREGDADKAISAHIDAQTDDGYRLLMGGASEGIGHAERVEFGKEYAKRLLAKHKEDLVYFGIGGSTYANKDRLDSDIDAFVVTESKDIWPDSKWPSFMFKGIVVSIGYYTLGSLDEIIETPNYMWPYRVYRTIHSLPFYDKYDLIDRYKEMVEGIAPQKFVDAVQEQLVIAYSSLGKIKRHAERDELAATRAAATETFAEFLDASVALLNRGLLPGGYGFLNLDVISRFKYVPKRYVELSTKIWEGNNPEEIRSAAEGLLQTTVEFAKEFGVTISNYTSIDRIRV